MSQKTARIYTALARIYDEIMKDVDYLDWADFIDAIIQEHRPDAETLLELACGTGKVAMHLDELDCYEITATDFSRHMLQIGRQISDYRGMGITWKQLDFLNINLDEEFDVILALFDSVNYILKDEDLQRFFSNVEKVMHSDSIFIFDFTTPAHSEYVASLLNDEGITPDNIRFERRSFYIPTEKVHVNEFDIEFLDNDKLTILKREREVHRQRIFELKEMRKFIEQSGLEIVAAYEDFDLIDAGPKSERVTMVLKPK